MVIDSYKIISEIKMISVTTNEDIGFQNEINELLEQGWRVKEIDIGANQIIFKMEFNYTIKV